MTALSTRAFLDLVAARLTDLMPTDWGAPRVRRRWSWVQASYGDSRLHYELWLQSPRNRVELGLHLEAGADLNGRLMQALGAEMREIEAELGRDFELEQWTASWGRVHTYMPYTRLDAEVAEKAMARLVEATCCLQPRVEKALAAAPVIRRAGRRRASRR